MGRAEQVSNIQAGKTGRRLMSISISTLGVLWPIPGRVYIHEYYSSIEVDARVEVPICLEMSQVPTIDCGMSSDGICATVEVVQGISSAMDDGEVC